MVDVIPVDASEKSSSEDAAAGKSVNTGYKIVFDNIDKNVNPRHMRSDNQTRSLHYVQSYAVKDRINYDGTPMSSLQKSMCLIFSLLEKTTNV